MAQVSQEPKYGYEVAAIKKADPSARGVRIGPGAQGGLRTTNTNLLTLITFAYDVRDYQIIDAPGWARGEGYDVSFTPDKPEVFPKPGEGDLKTLESMMDRQRQRVQAILRDRFGLKLRQETRELPIYTLNVAKNGSQLQSPDEKKKGPSIGLSDKGELTGVGSNMRMLADILSNILKQPVVDHTGIDTLFDFKLRWKPDTFVGGPGNSPLGDAPIPDADGPSIFTAISEQLGLKLESKKGPVKVYVVERAERPGEN